MSCNLGGSVSVCVLNVDSDDVCCIFSEQIDLLYFS